MFPLLLELLPFMCSCVFQEKTLLPIIISLQKLLFLPLTNNSSGVGSTEKKKVRNIGQGREAPHSLSLAKQVSSHWGYRPPTYKSYCGWCYRCAGKGIFFACCVCWSQQARGQYLGTSQMEEDALDSMKVWILLFDPTPDPMTRFPLESKPLPSSSHLSDGESRYQLRSAFT